MTTSVADQIQSAPLAEGESKTVVTKTPWWDRPAFTIRTEFYKPEKGRYLHPSEHRPITVREAARCMSFPDDFEFPEDQPMTTVAQSDLSRHAAVALIGLTANAPVGTPVWASASGRVVEAGMKHGSGNTVVIAHSNGLNTRYYHLSKFARGLHAGQQVRQKDVIGFVGTTGLSTGPHLHFSVTKNGAFVDPSKLAVNRDPPVPDRGAYMAAIQPQVSCVGVMTGALQRLPQRRPGARPGSARPRP